MHPGLTVTGPSPHRHCRAFGNMGEQRGEMPVKTAQNGVCVPLASSSQSSTLFTSVLCLTMVRDRGPQSSLPLPELCKQVTVTAPSPGI